MADAYSMDVEEVKKAVSEDAVKEELLFRKTAEFVRDNVKRIDPKPAEEEKEEKPAEEAPAEKPKRTRKTSAKKAASEEKKADSEKKSEE